MRLWDYIFPDDKNIIICGAGKNGRDWLDFLCRLGKNVRFFFDNNAGGLNDIDGVRVTRFTPPPPDSLNPEIILISPHKGAEEIFRQVRDLGWRDIRMGVALRFLPRYENLDLESGFPPFGHFYSLYPDLHMVDKKHEEIWQYSTSGDFSDAVFINEEKQCAVLESMNSMYESFPDFPSYGSHGDNKYRYRKGNSAIGISDSMVLHFMIRLLKPKHYIEVGSGFSSALALDTNEYFLEQSVDMKFIEPYPELFYSLLKKEDVRENLMIPKGLQDIPLSYFDVLEENDILFIDSTHVSKFGSDVNYLFFHILPRLKKGVYVHLHDILYPWQYPAHWIKKGMGWNEMFLLRAFLQYNKDWEIVFFNHYMAFTHPELYHEEWRKIPDLGGGSFWMKKC